MSRVVTFCPNPTVDQSTSVEQVIADVKLRCGDPLYEPGGGGVNVARAMHALGGAPRVVWTRGGVTGRMLSGLLDDHELDHVPVDVRGETRLNTTVLERSSGRQYRIGLPGPRLDAGEAEACLDALGNAARDAEILVLSGSLPRGVPDGFYARAAEEGARRDTRVVLDTSGPALRRGTEGGVYLVKPNVRELGQLVGEPVEDDEAVLAAARGLIDGGRAENVLVSLGAGGAFLVTPRGADHIRAPTVPIRSRVGAGDSMLGGLVLWLSEGRPLAEAVRYGVAAGAAAVTRPGTGLARRQDAERLYRRIAGTSATAGGSV